MTREKGIKQIGIGGKVRRIHSTPHHCKMFHLVQSFQSILETAREEIAQEFTSFHCSLFPFNSLLPFFSFSIFVFWLCSDCSAEGSNVERQNNKDESDFFWHKCSPKTPWKSSAPERVRLHSPLITTDHICVTKENPRKRNDPSMLVCQPTVDLESLHTSVWNSRFLRCKKNTIKINIVRTFSTLQKKKSTNVQ